MDLIWRSGYDAVGVSEICLRAKVNKGSFYHFFKSKEILAVEALQASWQDLQPQLDQIFSAQRPPLQRILDYCDLVVEIQEQRLKKAGFVCGCPYTTVGLEKCAQSEGIRQTVERLLDQTRRYLYSAVRDAAEAGDIPVKNVRQTTQDIFSYYLGAFTQARVYNDLSYVKCLKRDVKRMLAAQAA